MKQTQHLWLYHLMEPFGGFSAAGGTGVLVQGGGVVLVNLQSGVRTVTLTVAGESQLRGEPLVTGGRILVSSPGKAYCIDARKAGLGDWEQAAGGSSRRSFSKELQ